MLLRRGIPTNLRVGFRKQDGRIEGHAWLEREGAPVNDLTSETEAYAQDERPMNFDHLKSLL
jgi:hypothetical protein